jgi:hypothetical protein
MSNQATDQYKLLDYALPISPCGFCGAIARMWQHSNGDAVRFFVCCSRIAANTVDTPEGNDCPLSMPPEDFYKARRVEAAKYWEAWATFGNKHRT